MLRSRAKLAAIALLFATAAAITYPVFGEKKPQSLLPPGFGDPKPQPPSDQKPDKAPAVSDSQPSDLLDDLKLKTPDQVSGTKSASTLHADVPSSDTDALGNAVAVADDTAAAPAPAYDLPPEARRSLAQIGLLGVNAGGYGDHAFGNLDGRGLEWVMRMTAAPIASRWVSIVLRRALLSDVMTPSHVNGADWTAERAWLLLRMGEADSARMLIQRVDSDNYTPKLYQVAMQSALANADMAGFCPLVANAQRINDEPAWVYGRAMCASLSGESGSASSLLRDANQETGVQGIDALLAERFVGAGKNSRHAVVIEWSDVTNLSAWRFGTATAVGLTIPSPLFDTVRPNVRAWLARAPMLKLSDRTDAVDWAAALGVYSNSAMVDFYSALTDNADQVRGDTSPSSLLQTAYAGDTPDNRMVALQALWTAPNLDQVHQYARLILTARAAALFPIEAAQQKYCDALTASMLTAGLDIQAERWARIASDGDDNASRRAWGLLAVGAPQRVVEINDRRISAYRNTGDLRSKFLVAGLIGLGRIEPANAARFAGDYGINIAKKTIWSRAIDAAAQRGERGTVALMAATGMQSFKWSDIPPEHLFHIVSALRQVGLEPEARMVAAEALTRA